jgi:hypothetical protein
MVRNLILEVNWKNRATIYWVPALMIGLVLPDFAWFLDSFNPIEGIKFLFLASILVFFFEYRLFGFRIELSDTSILYRERGFPTFSTREFFKKDIKSYTPVYFDKAKRVRSAYIELNVSGKQVFINVASFKPRDVKMLEEWLSKN